MLNNLQVILIAGGSGKCMRPLVTHKSLFPFLGTTILEHTLHNLAVFKPSKIIIVAHPAAQIEVEAIASKYSAQVVVQPESHGMANAITIASGSLDQALPVIVIDAITVQEPQVFQTFSDAIDGSPTSIILAGRKVTEYKHGGYFAFDKDHRVTKIIEKPGADNMPSSYLKLVLDYFPNTHDMIDAMKSAKSTHDDVYEVALSQMITQQGANMIELSGSHASLKHAYRVLDVMDVFIHHYLTPGIHASAQIAKTAVIEGDVQISSGVKVFDHATIKGPCYIGRDTVIGNGALVRSSCIEAGCEIGYNTEVARSYIGPNTKCHTSYVGDSILEGEINLAAGTITANLRFDGKNVLVNLPSGKIDTGRRKFGAILAKGVKTGIHASIMPGTVLESNTIIGTEVQHDQATG